MGNPAAAAEEEASALRLTAALPHTLALHDAGPGLLVTEPNPDPLPEDNKGSSKTISFSPASSSVVVSATSSAKAEATAPSPAPPAAAAAKQPQRHSFLALRAFLMGAITWSATITSCLGKDA